MKISMSLLIKIKNLLESLEGTNITLSSKQIGEMLNIEDMGVSRANIRRAITQSIERFELPIGSGGRGYYWIDNQSRLNKTNEFYDNKIQGIEERKSMINKNYNSYYSNN